VGTLCMRLWRGVAGQRVLQFVAVLKIKV
jgi:hypothetical protein